MSDIHVSMVTVITNIDIYQVHCNVSTQQYYSSWAYWAQWTHTLKFEVYKDRAAYNTRRTPSIIIQQISFIYCTSTHRLVKAVILQLFNEAKKGQEY